MDLDLGALLGVAGAVVGFFAHWGVARLDARSARQQAANDTYAALVTGLADAVKEVELWAAAGEISPEKRRELRSTLNRAYSAVYYRCPVELTLPATDYVRFGYALLDGRSPREDAMDSASQKLNLTLRQVTGVNKAVSRSARGEPAKAQIASD